MASNSNSGQKFISRNRKPRVHITYEDPYDSEKLIELPFVMGVLADLSHRPADLRCPVREALNNSGENAVSAKRCCAFNSAIITVTGPAKAR